MKLGKIICIILDQIFAILQICSCHLKGIPLDFRKIPAPYYLIKSASVLAELPRGEYTHEEMPSHILANPEDVSVQVAMRGFFIMLAISMHAVFEGKQTFVRKFWTFCFVCLSGVSFFEHWLTSIRQKLLLQITWMSYVENNRLRIHKSANFQRNLRNLLPKIVEWRWHFAGFSWMFHCLITFEKWCHQSAKQWPLL